MKHDGQRVLRTVDYAQTVSGQKFTLSGADLCPSHSPVTGLPLVIESITLVCEITSASLATTAVSGEDVWRCAREVSLTQIDKVARINSLDGDQLRLAAIEMAGIGRVREHADWAIGSLNGLRVELPIYLDTPLAYEEHDSGLMPSMVQTLSWKGITTGVDGPCVAGGALTFGTATWYVLVECRETTYIHNGPAMCWDQVVVGANKDYVIPIDGKGVGAIIVHRRGQDGGQLTTNLTRVVIDQFGKDSDLKPADLVHIYERDRDLARGWGAVTGSTLVFDPFITGRALPLRFAGDAQKCKAQPYDRLQYRSLPSGAYTDITVLVRTIAPRFDGIRAKLESVYAGGEKVTWRNKTRDRTQRNATSWPTQFLPQKAEIAKHRAKF